MLLKPKYLVQAVALAMMLPGVAAAEFEISGVAKIEYSVFTDDGQVTGAAQAHSSGDAQKSEPSIKLFINSDVGEESAFHAELLLADDGEAASDRLEGGEEYTQYEILREFYFDTNGGGWDFRLGKQQVVWGTADGIKLLDIINPTDFRELNQNVMEDARIPVWMINAEKEFEEGGNVQLIVSEARPNFIAGLDAGSDSGAPFIFKGVDTITGTRNGFLNVAPNLSGVAANFTNAAIAGLFGANAFPTGLSGFSGISVDGFSSTTLEMFDPNGDTNLATGAGQADDFALLPGLVVNPALPGIGGTAYAGGTGGAYQLPGFAVLNNITQNGLFAGDPNANGATTNLMPEEAVTATNPFGTSYDPTTPGSAFEYMPLATFATFNSFSGVNAGTPGTPAGFQTQYIKEHEDENNINFGGRYKATTDSGVNFSLNAIRHYSSNPSVNLSWHDAATGEKLTVVRHVAADEVNAATGAPGTDGFPDFVDTTSASLGVNQVPNSFATVSVLLQNSAGQYYGPLSPNPFDGVTMSANDPILRFTESMHEVNSIGASFDAAIDGLSVPIVLRGEFLFSMDEKQPVIDKRLLAIGDIANALKMEDTDLFKYVLGVDITVATNMLVSTQLIQFYNLDHVDENRTCTTQGDLSAAAGGPITTNGTTVTGVGSQSFDCSRYTGDFSSMSMLNQLKKGDEVETFVSLFLSKPFGPDVQHRWNNITIAENGGGYWNRFDVEYSFNDEMIGLVEWNKYWGDDDTTFGQFEDSSNLQLGFKYLF